MSKTPPATATPAQFDAAKQFILSELKAWFAQASGTAPGVQIEVR